MDLNGPIVTRARGGSGACAGGELEELEHDTTTANASNFHMASTLDHAGENA
jgi:hypothetical protein